VPFFLRRVTFASWQGRTPINDEDRVACRGDFALGDADTDGLSLFEADAEDDRRLIVAAIACGRRNLNNVDLLEIAGEELNAFGDVVRTPGGYPVAQANLLHRSLPWEQARLNALADSLLALGRCATRYRKPAVKAATTALALEAVEAGPHREWLASLKAAP
jgi:hypothetical protein